MKTDYIAWAAVAVALAGLLWTMNTGFNSVHERLDRMQSAIAALDGRVSRIEGWIEGRFDSQSASTTQEAPEPPQ